MTHTEYANCMIRTNNALLKIRDVRNEANDKRDISYLLESLKEDLEEFKHYLNKHMKYEPNN